MEKVDYERMWNKLENELSKMEEGDDIHNAKIAHAFLRMMEQIKSEEQE